MMTVILLLAILICSVPSCSGPFDYIYYSSYAGFEPALGMKLKIMDPSYFNHRIIEPVLEDFIISHSEKISV